MISFVASDLEGGGHLRSVWPAEALRAEGIPAEATMSWEPAEVVVVHRPLGEDTLERIRELQAQGSRVLVDEDDDLNRVAQTGNKAAIEHCTPERLTRHDLAIQEADGLIVSTPRLAEIYGPRAREVHVAPNRLPAWAFRRRPRMRGPVRVGWAGIVLTHRQDLRWIRPTARAIEAEAEWYLIGDPHTGVVLGIDRARTEPWQPNIAALYALMGRADVGVVPLAPNGFNRAKSWLKALEFMAAGVPVVATDLPEQRRLIRHGTDGYLAGDPETFAEAVLELVRDEELRNRMGAAAQERARELGELRADEWKAALDPVSLGA